MTRRVRGKRPGGRGFECPIVETPHRYAAVGDMSDTDQN
jgi:hypothetical protein